MPKVWDCKNPWWSGGVTVTDRDGRQVRHVCKIVFDGDGNEGWAEVTRVVHDGKTFVKDATGTGVLRETHRLWVRAAVDNFRWPDVTDEPVILETVK